VKRGERRKGKREIAPVRLTFLLSLFSFPAFLCCTSITTRPNIRPFPLATFDTVVANPAAVIEAAQKGVTDLGLQISAVSVAEGYLETRWFDVRTRRSHRTNTNPELLVRLRVWADLATPRESQVVIETVRRQTIDPSVPDREVELVAEAGTPGDSLTHAIQTVVRSQFGKK
jgi:hypothetical protein